jgi:ribonucleoside-diphosphate reductase beta chain
MSKERNMFEAREVYKPFEYDELEPFVKSIQRTYWIVDEVAAELQEDVQDYHNKLSENDKYIISTILRTFADTETKVLDDCWAVIGKYFPKPEFQVAAMTFAENEARHGEAYFEINQLLDLTDFAPYSEDPVLAKKFDNLTNNSLNIPNFDKTSIDDIRKLAKGLAIFSAFTERVSLFSQFMIMRSFSSNKRSLLKGIGNIIDWSSRDEQIHGLAGIWMFNQIKEEYPQIWTSEFKSEIYTAASTTVDIEKHVLDQIFEKGNLPNLDKKDLVNYMKARTNDSLVRLDLDEIYDVDEEALERVSWFEKGLTTLQQVDFLDSRSTDYTKKMVSFTAGTVKVTREEMAAITKPNFLINKQ